MIGLPLLVAAEDATGSYAGAGAAAGAFGIGVAVFSPLRGRWIDRRGTRSALPPLLALHALALVAMAAAASGPLVVAAAALAGAGAPSLPAAMRLEWQRMLGADLERLPTAYAFESVAQVTLFVIGPVLAGAGIALLGADAVLVAAAVLVLLAGGLFVARTAARPVAAPAGGSLLGPIRERGVQTLVGATVLADMSLGALEVGILAFADDEGSQAAAGILLALFALGSAAGGAVYGARRWTSPVPRRLVVIMLIAAVAILPFSLAGSVAVLAVMALLGGIPFAAGWATTTTALDAVAPRGSDAEAYNWLSSANATGVAVGSLAGGAVIEASGPDAAFLVASGALAAGAAFVALRVSSLRAPRRPGLRAGRDPEAPPGPAGP